jgi:hypothetical protein
MAGGGFGTEEGASARPDADMGGVNDGEDGKFFTLPLSPMLLPDDEWVGL